jgi:hypothetical protein
LSHLWLAHAQVLCKIRLINLADDNTLIKSGEGIEIDEIHALRLAREHQLPVPEVYEAHPLPNRGASINMSYMPGETLEKVWPTMTPDQKHDIALQLRAIVDKMRSIPSDDNTFCSCSGGMVRDLRSKLFCIHLTSPASLSLLVYLGFISRIVPLLTFCTTNGRQLAYNIFTGGPFLDEESFNNFVMDIPKSTPKAIRDGLRARLRCNNLVVLTHGDLPPRNIMVQENKITGLIDWEVAGWFPEYWEYVKFFHRPCLHNDWYDYASDIFSQPYTEDLINFQGLSKWLRP